MVRVPSDRSPTHPGEILLQEFLEPLSISQQELANQIHVPYPEINDLVNGQRGIATHTALRLSKFFGTTPEFWLNLQLRWDLYHTQRSEADILNQITPCPATALG